MPILDEAIIREYLEQNGFLTRSLRKTRSQSKKTIKEEGLDIYASNPNFVDGVRAPSFLLFSSELRYVKSMVICIRGWHSDKAALASMSSGPDILKHLESSVLKKVKTWIDLDGDREELVDDSALKVLVAPVFPRQEAYRRQCAAALREKGVDAIISFKSVLLDLIDRSDTKLVYPKSEAMQMLRVLKTFDLIKDSQMNFLT